MKVENLKIQKPYTLEEIILKYESNDYSAELLLQHALLLLIKKEGLCK